MKRKITLTSHNPTWPQQFEAEATTLTSIFGQNLSAIHHIGSTAVPGIQAKPIIDMMPIVWDIEQVDGLNEAMTECGYIHRGEHGIPGRRYFRKGSDQHHTHHIHVFQTGHPDIARHLLFRDYLRTYPDKAQAYDQLKTELAQQYRNDTVAYTAGKSDFIQTLDQEAAGWQHERERPLRTLITSRLQLIALSLPQLESCLQDPSLLASNLGIPLENDIFNPIVRQATTVKVSKMRLVPSTQHHWNAYWLIVHIDKNLGMGMAGFKGQPDLSGEIEIGYGISPRHRKHGFITEAVQTLTRWALAQPECTAVFALTDPDNIPSHHVLEKIGMKRVGEKDGEWRWELRVDEFGAKCENTGRKITTSI